jgi:hypothetical protein
VNSSGIPGVARAVADEIEVRPTYINVEVSLTLTGFTWRPKGANGNDDGDVLLSSKFALRDENAYSTYVR